MTKEELLIEIEDLLRTMPPRATIRHDTEENQSWLGRAMAIIKQWNMPSTIEAQGYLGQFLQGQNARQASRAFSRFLVLLHQARNDLRIKTVGPLNVVVPTSMVYDYFDEIRRIIEIAKSDIFFVDPYLDASFISLYLPNVSPEVSIRLLAREKLQTLVPAAQLFVKQNQSNVAIRSAPNFHDRYVFVDRSTCYQSGASFKDGGRTAPTTITQITDAFVAISQTYEGIWQSAKIEL